MKVFSKWYFAKGKHCQDHWIFSAWLLLQTAGHGDLLENNFRSVLFCQPRFKTNFNAMSFDSQITYFPWASILFNGNHNSFNYFLEQKQSRVVSISAAISTAISTGKKLSYWLKVKPHLLQKINKQGTWILPQYNENGKQITQMFPLLKNKTTEKKWIALLVKHSINMTSP